MNYITNRVLTSVVDFIIFIAQKNYILMNMSAECAFCFLIKLKNSRYFYIIKSSVSLFNRTANKDLISSVHGLNGKLSQGLNLLDADIL
jgi:hypothetical protein